MSRLILVGDDQLAWKTVLLVDPNLPIDRLLAEREVATLLAEHIAFAQILGSPPSKLPAGKSVYRISGDVDIDGKKGTLDSKITGGTQIKTGANSELVYVVGESAYIARPQTEIVVDVEFQKDS